MTNRKIKPLNELAAIVQDLKNQGKTVVLCHGCFDLVHPGHILHFEAAKKMGDTLIVTITADNFVNKGPGRPVFSEQLRAEFLAALECVDFVAINPAVSAIGLIELLKPNIYCKGAEYQKALNDPSRNLYKEAEAVKAAGGRICFTDEPTFSSTRLLKEHFNLYPEDTKIFLDNFSRQFGAGEIISRLKELKNLKVLVIGEAIIDEYHYCKGMGKVPKDNLVATRYLNEEIFAGGVLACANHLAGFCDNVHLVSCLGEKDSREAFILKNLKPNIKAKFFYQPNASTIIKRRFIDPAFFNKMFEIYYFDDSFLPSELSKEVCDYLNACLESYDVVLATDYGHGFFDKNIISLLCAKSKFLAVNTQTNSANLGFNLITKYPRVDYVCIDEPEARLAMYSKDATIEELAQGIFMKTGAKKIIITRGHYGCAAFDAENKEKSYSVPVLSTRVVDRVGAGDAFLAITAPLVSLESFPIDLLGFIGNAVGALKVLMVGNKSSVEPNSLFKFIQTLLK